DRVDQLTRALERLVAPPADDRARDLLRKALFAELPEDPDKLAFGCLIDELAGRIVRRRVHPHVERRVSRIGEATLRPVDLHRRNAEVEQDRVGTGTVIRELLEHDRKVAAQETALDAGLLAKAVEVGARVRVAVDRDQAALAAQVGSEERRMAPRAEGGVHNGLAG